MITIYEHDGKEIYKDETGEYEIEDIRAHYAQFDQRLVTATYTVIPPEKEGEPRKVIFAKKTGTKGLDPVIAALLAIPPATPTAFELVAELSTGPDLTIEDLLFMAPELEAAQAELKGLASRSYLAVERCRALRPAPAPVPPVGF